jgi:hypothetical protein
MKAAFKDAADNKKGKEAPIALSPFLLVAALS